MRGVRTVGQVQGGGARGFPTNVSDQAAFRAMKRLNFIPPSLHPLNHCTEPILTVRSQVQGKRPGSCQSLASRSGNEDDQDTHATMAQQ